jgi:predicted Zn-dependent protease
MPGDRIVITRELISRASRPEEVAGVLAHEIGHAANRHPEAQMVRIMGIQILINLITGGNSDAVTSMAGFAALLRYSRGAESEADAYANRIMIDAAIDPLGLRNFFRGLLKEEQSKGSAGPFEVMGSLLSTHPDTEERMNRIQPLPDGIMPRPVLSDAQWQALRQICD